MARIGFIGCHKISKHCLQKIAELSHKFEDELIVVFNLDPEKGSKHSAYADFTSLQQEFSFDLHYVSDVADEENIHILQNSKLDILFIIGWHKIVSQSVLNVAKLKLGIHSSLLPKDRGSSPINWQLIRGEKVGGVTLFHLTAGVDAGNIVDKQSYNIDDLDDVRSVYEKAISASIDLLDKNWSEIHNLKPKSIPQDEKEVTINERRKPSDSLIDWSKTAKQCYDWIRALTTPYPGAFTYWKGKKILLWSSRICDIKNTEPGQIIECGDRIIISTGEKCIELLSLQVEDELLCDAKTFSQNYALEESHFFSNS